MPKTAASLTLIAITVFVSLGSVKADNLVTNGDFSINADDSHFAFGGYGAVPDWNFAQTGNTGEGVNGPNISPGYFGPTNKTADNMGKGITDYAFIQLQSDTSTGTLYQSFDVTAGTTYALSYDAAGRSGYFDGNGLTAEITDGTSPDSGTVLFEQTSGPLPGDQFYTNTTTGTSPDFTTVVGSGLTFTADTTGEVTLAFTVDNLNDDPDVSIDFTNVNVAVAPEPSTYAMLLAGCGVLLFLGRRCVRRQA